MIFHTKKFIKSIISEKTTNENIRIESWSLRKTFTSINRPKPTEIFFLGIGEDKLKIRLNLEYSFEKMDSWDIKLNEEKNKIVITIRKRDLKQVRVLE